MTEYIIDLGQRSKNASAELNKADTVAKHNECALQNDAWIKIGKALQWGPSYKIYYVIGKRFIGLSKNYFRKGSNKYNFRIHFEFL